MSLEYFVFLQVVLSLAVAGCLCAPEAEPEADAYYGYYGYGLGYHGLGYRAYGYGYPYAHHYGHYYGKRSADAEPEADASLYGGFSGAGYYGLGLSGGCLGCGGLVSSYSVGGGEWRPWYLRGGGHGIWKREAETEPEADASLGYGLGGIIGVQQGIPLAAAPVATIAAAPVITTRTVAVAAPAITTTTVGGGLLAGGLGLAGAHPW